jgi:hypothetical protein
VVALPPDRRRTGTSRRGSFFARRRRKHAPDHEAAIRSTIGDRTLRELAAEFGVRHETMRRVLRQRVPEVVRRLG